MNKDSKFQQMGLIYSKAEQVMIWLGEATYDTDYVMYYMKRLERDGFKHASVTGIFQTNSGIISG